MNISAISLSLTRPGGLSLESQVAALFAAGEQGAWYDPSTFSTMFNEASGATPVTTVEQPVGLILDRRKGLALGAELNDGLDDAGNWTALGTNTIGESGGEITVTYVDNATGATAALSAAAGLSTDLTVNAWYKITGEAKVNTGSVTVRVSAATTFDSTAITSTSFVPFTIYFPASNATTNTLTFTGMGSGETITVRSISVKLIDGNHAYQTTSAARPVLRSRYNLLTYSEQFDNAAWTTFGGITITANDATAPDGTQTAERLTAATVTTKSVRYQTGNPTGRYTFSIYAKLGTARFLFMEPVNSSTQVWFDLQTGLPGTNNVSGSVSSMVSVGSGWYRCSVYSANHSSTLSFGFSNADNSTSQTIGEYSWLWGAQYNLGSTATAYQRIAAAPTATSSTAGTVTYATTSTMGGEVFRPYLSFDGSDDSLRTADIAFTATDEMTVCTGVQKQSDANVGTLAELSATIDSNNGTFALFAPGTLSSARDSAYLLSSKGTAKASAGPAAASYAAPVRNVVTGTADISADTLAVRVNGTQTSTATNDQGTGNYGTFPIFIGRRNSASDPLNGFLYSLILRAKTCSAGELASLESYVAGKTGVTL